MSVLFGIPVDLAYHLVCWLAAILAPLLGGLAAAAAIVAFTMLIRLGLLPLGYLAFRGEKARNRLLPQMQDLQRRHARDPERLRAELAALQRAEGAGLFAGCLPLLVQIPFFSVMYRLFLSRSVAGAPNALLGHRLLAASLGSRWLAGGGLFSPQGLVFAVLFALLAGVALVAVRAARGAAAPAGAKGTAAPARTPAAAGTPAAERAVSVLGRLLPFGTLVMAAVVPLAAGLYLLTTTAWTLAERAAIKRWGPVR
jgi:YidC/Oxa1 family membrane protein insertase